jgi:hypothetical protein
MLSQGANFAIWWFLKEGNLASYTSFRKHDPGFSVAVPGSAPGRWRLSRAYSRTSATGGSGKIIFTQGIAATPGCSKRIKWFDLVISLA